MRLHDYLERIGVPDDGEDGVGGVSVDTLRRLHRAHRETFLFENITIQSGGRISLALGDLERKFIDERCGGYCFEHNTLFAAALRELGFEPTTQLGRVRRGPPERWCRTHMVLRMPVGRETWMADVGFGAIGLVEPIPLREGTSGHGGFEYTLRREGSLWVLSMRDASGSAMDLYEFSEEPQTAWDVEVANHFTATHPESVFRRTLTIQRIGAEDRVILRNEAITRYRAGVLSEEPLEASQLRTAARDLFGITLPDRPLVCETCDPAGV